MLSMMMITAITAVALPHLRITTLSAVRSLAMAYVLAAGVVSLSSQSGVLSLFNDSLSVDTLGAYIVTVALVVQVAVLAYYTSGVVSSVEMPYTLVIMLIIMFIGAYYLVIAGDLVTVAVALETQSFSLYALTALCRWREGATSAGLMYFMLGAFSSGLVLLGLSMIYAFTGETALAPLTAHCQMSGAVFKAPLVVIMSGFLFKVTAAPFHWWGPEVYDRVPTVITVIINVMPKLSLLAVIARLSPLTDVSSLAPMIMLVVVLSWGFGSVVGLVQTRIKRLLAYSTVSHVGWLLAGVTAGSALGVGGFLFYLAQYSFTSVLTFLVLIGISYAGVMSPLGLYRSQPASDVEWISSLNGLSARSTIFTMMLAASLLSAAGIPPFIGFYAKLSVMQALLYGSSPLLVAAGVLSSVVSAGYYLSVISTMLFKPQAT